MVNLVGGYASGGLVHETPIDEFERMLTTNLRPTYLVTQAALPHLVAAGGGAVVCVSARAAVAPFPGAAGYVTAKAAVLAFANAVAVEYRSRNVRCNTVLPSVIDTPANRAAQPDADHSRWVSPAEIAPVIHFLASAESAPTSGASRPGLRAGLNRHRRDATAGPLRRLPGRQVRLDLLGHLLRRTGPRPPARRSGTRAAPGTRRRPRVSQPIDSWSVPRRSMRRYASAGSTASRKVTCGVGNSR